MQANGNPFEVFVPENRYLFVSSAKHIKEVDAATDDVLSLQAAAKQLLQPKYTMHNFNWFNKRGVEGTPLVRTLRTFLTNNIPDILPEIRLAISKLFDDLYDTQPVVDGVKHSLLYKMVKEAVAYSNALSFFGKELAHNREFIEAAVNFIESTILISEIIRLLPHWIAPTIGKYLAKKWNSHEAIHNTLVSVTEQRLEERERARRGIAIEKHKDCIQWVIETSPKEKPWSAERIVHKLMALWFGSVHILTATICFTIHDLCLQPEYIFSIRAELESSQGSCFEKTGKGLLLLNSFIKESARTTPVESMSTRRQALQPFILSGGFRVETGEWVCTPARAMMRDPANFPQPLEFQGFRFVEEKHLKNISSSILLAPDCGEVSALTDVANWQFWGTGRMSW
ncbi:hypothetical protein HYALB_00004738 [Hymenoscyphus albidus]|uniref:Cytochrome P450 n=1 Tax=Hymenoscyphus albidus TaxID=595503 RepID=A0A9N9Q6M2_9HELO|nr:hypothetical protein HYALB_00004738 [Hymenoscyphus albidus]